MPSIRKRNGRYQVQVRVLGRQKSATFNSRNDAKRWAALMEAELIGYTSSLEKYKPKNLSEILTKYLICELPKKNAHDVEKYILKSMLREDWALMPIEHVTAFHMSCYRDRRL